MRAFAHSAEAVIPADATSLPNVQSRDQSSYLPIACIADLPGNVRQPTPLDLPRSAESTSVTPFAVDFSISSEEVQEDHTEQVSPPEVTPSHLREIDHV